MLLNYSCTGRNTFQKSQKALEKVCLLIYFTDVITSLQKIRYFTLIKAGQQKRRKLEIVLLLPVWQGREMKW